MGIEPLSDACLQAYRRKEHLCFGVSPFNSLFSQEYLERLIDIAQSESRGFHFFLPDEPTIHTLEAMGYHPEEARKKMRKQINWLRNKIQKALEKKGLLFEEHVLDWKTLERNPVFRSELDEVYGFFDTNHVFRNFCLEASHWVLQNKLSEEAITEDTLLKAVKYFLSEIPLFAATNKILGIESSVFCYHQSIRFHELLYTKQLAYLPNLGQGYGRIQLMEHSISSSKDPTISPFV